jgi:hypothetical protein
MNEQTATARVEPRVMRFSSDDLWELFSFSRVDHYEGIVAAVLQCNWETDSCTVDIRKSSDGGLDCVHVRVGNDVSDKADEVTAFLLDGCREDMGIGFSRVFLHLNHYRIADRPSA